MNKLLIDNIIYKDNIININNNVHNISVFGNFKVNIFNEDIDNLDVLINDNSSLEINYFNIIKKDQTRINIKTLNNAKFKFNYSFINEKTYNLLINTDFLEDSSIIDVNVFEINDGATSNIILNGYVKNNKINNELNENIKILNINGGKVTSMPNMFINNYLVKANHSNTISNINKQELFYLMSKGLNKENATKLIRNGFILKNLNDKELKIKVIEFLNRR